MSKTNILHFLSERVLLDFQVEKFYFLTSDIARFPKFCIIIMTDIAVIRFFFWFSSKLLERILREEELKQPQLHILCVQYEMAFSATLDFVNPKWLRAQSLSAHCT